MKIKKFSETLESLKEGAQIALTNRLFVNGWYMRTCLKRIFLKTSELRHAELRHPCPRKMPSLILITEMEGKPVACSLVIGNKFQVFVRTEYRRQGIATKMYRKSMKIMKRESAFSMYIGDERQRRFHAKMKVRKF